MKHWPKKGKAPKARRTTGGTTKHGGPTKPKLRGSGGPKRI
jgi:hypothetical protein